MSNSPFIAYGEDTEGIWQQPPFDQLPDGFLKWFWRNFAHCRDTHAFMERIRNKWLEDSVPTDRLGFRLDGEKIIAEMIREFEET